MSVEQWELDSLSESDFRYIKTAMMIVPYYQEQMHFDPLDYIESVVKYDAEKKHFNECVCQDIMDIDHEMPDDED